MSLYSDSTAMDSFFVYLSSENVNANVSKAIASNILPLQIDTVGKLWEVSLIKTAITHYWDNAVNIYISAVRIKEDGSKHILAFQIEDDLLSKTENLYNKINQALTEALGPNESPHDW